MCPSHCYISERNVANHISPPPPHTPTSIKLDDTRMFHVTHTCILCVIALC